MHTNARKSLHLLGHQAAVAFPPQGQKRLRLELQVRLYNAHAPMTDSVHQIVALTELTGLSPGLTWPPCVCCLLDLSSSHRVPQTQPAPLGVLLAVGQCGLPVGGGAHTLEHDHGLLGEHTTLVDA
jgi:hypothetical protein